MAKAAVTRINEAVDNDSQVLASFGLCRDGNGLICWTTDSHDHPRKWNARTKIYTISLIILLELFTTVISTTGAAVAHEAGPSYGLGEMQALVAFVSMYQFGQAVGGYLIPPVSELAGRWWPYFLSTMVFSAFCLVIPLGNHVAAVYAGRFATGLASAVPSVVIAGSIEDLFNSRERVWAVICWNSMTTIALCLGPIYAAHIIPSAGWQWVYYSASICTLVMSLALLLMKESRPSVILGRKIRVLRKTTTLADLRWTNADLAQDWRAWGRLVLVRPMHILMTEPLVMLVAITSGLSWSVVYLFTESVVRVYSSMGLGDSESSLAFLSLAAGVLVTLAPRFADTRRIESLQAAGKHIEPEDKMQGFAYAAPALTGGLVWFAWSVPPAAVGVHWVVPTLSLVPIGYAVNETAHALSGFLADSYVLYSASVFSGLALARAVISGVMPLVAHELYVRLDANQAGSVIAALSLVFAAAAVVFLRCSKALRRRSPFATYSIAMHEATQVELD
ncbi:major facilitator superfamily transporter [Microdochium trichocladiopsis]|uniref:Major facilitator superfamily transporter n=1 Tax=Microdochium trichocladiopsis TaxID=1682393 RepID=A0A9P9BUG8_9PEZI|nr:major facilitator superfamily transporter [Microdochium trichocladiopsis]KAH7040976.1 major facilitator superfamily transporter [Microdochium trichocladiopsis]